jgi:hypothetical protein
VPLPVRTLPVPMIEPAFRTPLVAVVGDTVLLPPGLRAASCAAIALHPIAVRTNPEHRLACLAAATPLPENHFALHRHPPAQADFDSGNGSCQGTVELRCGECGAVVGVVPVGIMEGLLGWDGEGGEAQSSEPS